MAGGSVFRVAETARSGLRGSVPLEDCAQTLSSGTFRLKTLGGSMGGLFHGIKKACSLSDSSKPLFSLLRTHSSIPNYVLISLSNRSNVRGYVFSCEI